MKRRKAETTSGIVCGQACALLQHLRIVVALTVALIALHNVALRGLGQADQPPLVPKPVIIDVSNPPTKPLLYRFTEKKPQPETELQFKGNGEWRFIKFEQLPVQTSLKVKGALRGYQDSEPLQENKWYSFKNNLAVVLEIKQGALSPVNISFWFGSPSRDADKVQAQEVKPEDMRAFIDSHELRPDTDKMTLGLTWEADGVPNPISINPSAVTLVVPESEAAPYERVTLNGDPKLWTFVRAKQLPVDIVLIARSSADDNLTVPTGTTLKSGEWIGFRNSVTLDVSMNSRQLSEGSRDLSFETAIAQSPDQTKDAVKADIKADKIVGNGNLQLKVSWKPVVDDSWPWLTIVIGSVILIIVLIALGSLVKYLLGLKQQRFMKKKREAPNRPRQGAQHSTKEPRAKPGETLGIKSASATAPSAAVIVNDGTAPDWKTAPPAGAAPSSGNAAVRQEAFTGLEKDLQKLWIELGKKADRTPGSPATQEFLAKKLSDLQEQVTSEFSIELEQRIRTLANAKEERTAQLESNQQGMGEEMTKLRTRDEEITKSVEANFQNIIEVDGRLKSQLAQFNEMLIQQAFPESFFARTLGMILSKNIDELREGNLERLIGECLNHFFQAEVPRADSLEELRTRAEGVVVALKRVAAIMTSLKPEVEDETRSRLQRVEALLVRVGGLQSQLQTRKLTINTTFTISAYPGARQTFLDELGRGIRSAIDKLGDPQSYFEGDLERLVTTDLIAIVDICDKTVSSPPGSNAELEAALKELFTHAGLREIVPHPGEPFGTAEQDLVLMVPGAAGTNMTVAQVITRGFYYTHRDNETLLRKAGVAVYR